MIFAPLLAFVAYTFRRGKALATINRHAVYYAVFFIALFWAVYQLMGMKKHFDIPEYLKGRESSPLTSLYTSVLAQSNAMPDTVPKSNAARVLFMLQVTSGWIWLLIFAMA